MLMLPINRLTIFVIVCTEEGSENWEVSIDILLNRKGKTNNYIAKYLGETIFVLTSTQVDITKTFDHSNVHYLQIIVICCSGTKTGKGIG